MHIYYTFVSYYLIFSLLIFICFLSVVLGFINHRILLQQIFKGANEFLNYCMSIPGHRFQFSLQYLLVLFISSKKCLKEDEKYCHTLKIRILQLNLLNKK